jgi:methyltransferase (TIGR00027 family)
MRPHRASFTAAFVATCRGLSPLLPRNVRLVDDPLGARVAGHAFAAVVNGLAQSPGLLRALAWVPLAPLFPWAVYMQVRTKALDDALLGFVAAGGRQVVILGAGFDARASRLREALGGAMVYEVDHPATQAKKRALFGEVPTTARYVAWDFERDAMTALPARLAAEGLDPAAPTFTLWEGVSATYARRTRYVGCARRELAASAAALTGCPMRPCRGLIYLVLCWCCRGDCGARRDRPSTSALRP